MNRDWRVRSTISTDRVYSRGGTLSSPDWNLGPSTGYVWAICQCHVSVTIFRMGTSVRDWIRSVAFRKGTFTSTVQYTNFRTCQTKYHAAPCPSSPNYLTDGSEGTDFPPNPQRVGRVSRTPRPAFSKRLPRETLGCARDDRPSRSLCRVASRRCDIHEDDDDLGERIARFALRRRARHGPTPACGGDRVDALPRRRRTTAFVFVPSNVLVFRRVEREGRVLRRRNSDS